MDLAKGEQCLLQTGNLLRELVIARAALCSVFAPDDGGVAIAAHSQQIFR